MASESEEERRKRKAEYLMRFEEEFLTQYSRLNTLFKKIQLEEDYVYGPSYKVYYKNSEKDFILEEIKRIEKIPVGETRFYEYWEFAKKHTIVLFI